MHIKEKAVKLTEMFSAIGGGIEIHYAINHIDQLIAARWVGYLDLKEFVEQLSDLEFLTVIFPDSQLYTELVNNHKEAINKAKNLIAELELQGLPAPFAAVHHNSLECYSIKTMKYSASIEGDSTWTYFYNLHHSNLSIKEIHELNNNYIDKVSPILAEICEIIALTIYNHLKAVNMDVLVSKEEI